MYSRGVKSVWNGMNVMLLKIAFMGGRMKMKLQWNSTRFKNTQKKFIPLFVCLLTSFSYVNHYIYYIIFYYIILYYIIFVPFVFTHENFISYSRSTVC